METLWTLTVLCAFIGTLAKLEDAATGTEKDGTQADEGIEELFKEFTDEVTIKVDIPSEKHRRHRRHIDSGDPRTVSFHIKGRTVVFQLDLQHGSLHAFMPGTLVERFDGNITEINKVNTDCLRTGSLVGLKESTGTLNICYKMTGVLGTEYGDFYFVPKKGELDSDVYRMWKGATPVKKSQPRSDESKPAVNFRSEELSSSISRQKRQAQQQRYLEVLLVTDQNLVEYHGADLYQQHLLTQMELVNKVYKHQSLGVIINVVVKRILVIDMRTSRRLVVERNAVHSLDRFCTWVRTESMRQFNHDGRHDIALYVTRENIGPAGYAHVTGLCNPKRSCTVIKDEGISSAFIIAHEMAHVFGIRHEGVRNRCVDDPSDGRLMASLVESTYYNFHWSECSREMMAQYLPRLYCLNNVPTNPGWPRLVEPLGISWGLDDQCQGEFTKKHTFCKFFLRKNPCEKLWCSLADEPFRCVTKHAPPLPGTTCGQSKWCKEKNCVESENLGGAAGWAEWSNWGLCSRTCGTGVHFRQRMCHRGRSQKVKDVCPGQEEEFRLCGKEPCPGGPEDYRAQQCQEFNDLDIDGKNSWLPYESDNATGYCKLTCISKETRDILVTESEVVDGTFCSYELPNHICIKGKCKRTGCDGKLNSRKSEDLCGVCGGDNTSCKKFNGVISETLRRQGYFRLFYLPAGTRNIFVEERYNRGVSIVLKDVETTKIFLNNETEPKESRELVKYGTRFVYHRDSSSQTLKARGPLQGDAMLMIYAPQASMPGYVTYDYSIPEEANDPDSDSRTQPLFKSDKYGWVDQGWSECSLTCGDGVQKTVHQCVSADSDVPVSPVFCSPHDEPAVETKPCSNRKCTYYAWKAEKWSACSATCGKTGLQQRYIRCLSYSYEKVRSVDAGYCPRSEMPEYTRECNREACVLDWSTGPWTKCRVTCGKGVQIRSVACPIPRADEHGGGDLYVCKGEKPSATKECFGPPCPAQTTPRPTTTTKATTTRRSRRIRPCRGDVSKAICRFGARSNTCRLPLYQRLCCKTCVALLLKT